MNQLIHNNIKNKSNNYDEEQLEILSLLEKNHKTSRKILMGCNQSFQKDYSELTELNDLFFYTMKNKHLVEKTINKEKLEMVLTVYRRCFLMVEPEHYDHFIKLDMISLMIRDSINLPDDFYSD